MTTPEPLNEEGEAPMLSQDQLEEYGYPESPNDKIHLMNLVTRGRPFVLITVQEDEQAAVDAAGLDLEEAFAVVSLVAEALADQV